MDKDLKNSHKIHFFGIGGIGISALARMMIEEGKEVSGSDPTLSPVTEELAKLGARIIQGQAASDVSEDVDLIIYSRALQIAVPELLEEIKSLGKKTLSYPEALSLVSRDKFTIAISGTHGKTTTTAMLGSILVAGGLEPTIVVGSMLKDRNSNFVSGRSKYFVVEADEYLRSFLNLYPKILVITNIDKDHLDYYKDLEDIQSAFKELALRVPEDGVIVYDSTKPNVLPALEGVKAKLVDYSKVGEVPKLRFPGEHNVENARAALSVARVLGVEEAVSAEALAKFAGTARRFEYKGETVQGALFYDDYAHNPQKVRAALKGAREQFKDKKIVALFQPHLYSRTKLLLPEFADSFGSADEVIVLPIYAAREKDDGSISSSILAKEIADKGTKALAMSFEEARIYLGNILQTGDLLLTLGAGEAHKVGEKLMA